MADGFAWAAALTGVTQGVKDGLSIVNSIADLQDRKAKRVETEKLKKVEGEIAKGPPEEGKSPFEASMRQLNTDDIMGDWHESSGGYGPGDSSGGPAIQSSVQGQGAVGPRIPVTESQSATSGAIGQPTAKANMGTLLSPETESLVKNTVKKMSDPRDYFARMEREHIFAISKYKEAGFMQQARLLEKDWMSIREAQEIATDRSLSQQERSAKLRDWQGRLQFEGIVNANLTAMMGDAEQAVFLYNKGFGVDSPSTAKSVKYDPATKAITWTLNNGSTKVITTEALANAIDIQKGRASSESNGGEKGAIDDSKATDRKISAIESTIKDLRSQREDDELSPAELAAIDSKIDELSTKRDELVGIDAKVSAVEATRKRKANQVRKSGEDGALSTEDVSALDSYNKEVQRILEDKTGVTKAKTTARRAAVGKSNLASRQRGPKKLDATKPGDTPSSDTPPVEGARKAKDGNWYVQDAQTGKWSKVVVE